MSVADVISYILLGALTAYFTPFFAVYLDEVVFETRWFSTYAPGWAFGVFELLYGFLTDDFP
jgi:hypothetical protein